MIPLVITLPYPPSINHYWRKWRNRMVISTEGRLYRIRVGQLLMAAGNPTFEDAQVRVDLVAYRPDARRRDLDNIRKAVYDSLQFAGVIDDDSQIVRDTGDKTPDIDRSNPRVEVTVTPI